MEQNDFITVSAAAESSGKPAVTIRRWARLGQVQSIKSGDLWLVKLQDVVDLSAQGYVGAPRQSLFNDPEATLKDVLPRVHQDMNQDKMPDIINHEDFISQATHEVELLAKQITTGTYTPKQLTMLEMPKGSLRSRPLARPAFEDRLVYEATVQEFAHSIDASLHPSVFANRLRLKPKRTKLTEDFGKQFRLFSNHYVDSASIVRLGITHVLVTDVTSFYEYVDHDTLLERIDFGPEHAQTKILLRKILSTWRTSSIAIGLPQFGVGSGILANAYLTIVDDACAKSAVGFARYSDDIRVYFKSEIDARRFAPVLVSKMRQLGLNLASGKTEIKRIEDQLLDKSGQRKSEVDYGLWIKDSASVTSLRSMFDESIAADNLNKTDFSFSLFRLGKCQDTHALKSLPAVLSKYPEASDIIVNYLYRLRTSFADQQLLYDYLLSPECIYSWEKIQYLRLIGTFDSVPERVRQFIRDLASSENGPLAEFAIRVLGQVGSVSDKKLLLAITMDNDRPPAIRRAAVIGLYALAENALDLLDPLFDTIQDQPRLVVRTLLYLLTRPSLPPTYSAW